MDSPQLLEARERNTLKLLAKHAGSNRVIRYSALRRAGFPEQLAQILGSRCEYLDSLANREFQQLQKKGWVALDGTGKIEILHSI